MRRAASQRRWGRSGRLSWPASVRRRRRGRRSSAGSCRLPATRRSLSRTWASSLPHSTLPDGARPKPSRRTAVSSGSSAKRIRPWRRRTTSRSSATTKRSFPSGRISPQECTRRSATPSRWRVLPRPLTKPRNAGRSQARSQTPLTGRRSTQMHLTRSSARGPKHPTPSPMPSTAA